MAWPRSGLGLAQGVSLDSLVKEQHLACRVVNAVEVEQDDRLHGCDPFTTARHRQLPAGLLPPRARHLAFAWMPSLSSSKVPPQSLHWILNPLALPM